MLDSKVYFSSGLALRTAFENNSQLLKFARQVLIASPSTSTRLGAVIAKPVA
jgi:hypothetical protein